MAGRYGISAIPTVLVFKGGQELQRLRMVGVQTKAAYQKAMDDAASS
jgi:thioredoxin-like negative regulator of GroEL